MTSILDGGGSEAVDSPSCPLCGVCGSAAMQVRHSSFVPFESHLHPSDRIDPGCVTRAYGLLVRWHRSGALSSDICYRAATLDPGGCGTHPGELKLRGQRLHSRTRSMVQGARATAPCASLICFPSQVRSCSFSPSSWVRPAATRGCVAGASCRQTVLSRLLGATGVPVQRCVHFRNVYVQGFRQPAAGAVLGGQHPQPAAPKPQRRCNSESDSTARCRRGGLGAAPPTRASLQVAAGLIRQPAAGVSI